MSIVVNKRPYGRCWSGNPIHYLLYSAAAEADPTNYFEIRIRFKRTDAAAYSSVITLPYKPVTGTARIDIQDILDGKLEYEIPNLPDEGSAPQAFISQKATGKFYIQFREITTAAPNPSWDDSESANEIFIVKGGISFEKWRGDNYWVNYFDVVLPFLTWQTSGTLHAYNKKMWLAWLNLTDIASSYIKIRRRLVFTDGSEDTVFLDCPVSYGQIAYFPAGGAQLLLQDVNVNKTIYYWELQVVNGYPNPNDPLTYAHRFEQNNRKDYNDITIHYRNSLGGIDGAEVRGVIDYNSQREFTQKEQVVLHDYFSGSFVNGRVAADNSSEILIYKGDIGHLSKEEQDRMRDLHLKRECWWARQQKWLPVLLLTGSQRVRTSRDKLFSMPLEFCIASGGNYYYTPDNINLQEGNEPAGLICTAVIDNLDYTYDSGTGWTVTWELISGTPLKYQVSTPAISGGAPQETTTTSFLYSFLPAGDHVITVRPVCLIGGVEYPGAAETITITVPAICIPVAISGSPVYLPDAVETVAYFFSLPLSGTAPFSITNIVKPSWMNIAINGSAVEITGTPSASDSGVNIPVSFDLSNCSGGGTASYSDTIDVFDAVANGDFELVNETTSGLYLIKNVFPIAPPFYSFSSGGLPVNPATTSSGIMTSGVTGAVSVFVVLSGLLCELQLFKNGVIQQTISISTSGTYSFDVVAFDIGDNMKIVLKFVS